MRTAGNVIWFCTGGVILGLFWMILGGFFFITIIFAPWGLACFEIGKISFVPFGREVVAKSDIDMVRQHNLALKEESESEDRSGVPMGLVRLLGNVVWFPFGLFLAFSHLVHGLILLLPIITIPFALQTWKLVPISLIPVGKKVVSSEVAQQIREFKASKQLGVIS